MNKVFESFEVEHEYRPDCWTTIADCISTYEEAEKHSVKGDNTYRILRVVKYLADPENISPIKTPSATGPSITTGAFDSGFDANKPRYGY